MTLRALLWLAVSTKTQAQTERDSLPTQERDLGALAQQQGWQVVDVLRVPGHSRNYIDIHDCARDMAQQGIDAFHRLLAHWQARDFDVLAVWDASRFARTQTLHAYVVERTISIGARLYSLENGGGWIDSNNFRMFIAMGGYSTAGEVDKLRKRAQLGYDARVRRGLPANHHIVVSHQVIRDPRTGAGTHVEVDRSKTAEWLDLVTVVCGDKQHAPVAWKSVERAMFERFGHANPLGQAYQPHHYYRIVYTPAFWGHAARHYKEKGRGAWTREVGHEVPKGVLIEYDKYPPALSGAAADKLKAELTRRENMRGHRRPQETYKFSGLLVCASCGFHLGYGGDGKSHAYLCKSKWESSGTRPSCADTQHVNEKKLIAWLDTFLQAGAGAPPSFIATPHDPQRDIERLTSEIAGVERQIQVMINKQSTADEALRDSYDTAMHTAGKRLKALRAQLLDAEKQQVQAQSSTRLQAWDKIVAEDKFWTKSGHEINQDLHALLGDMRIACSGGVAVGFRPAPKSKRRYR